LFVKKHYQPFCARTECGALMKLPWSGLLLSFEVDLYYLRTWKKSKSFLFIKRLLIFGILACEIKSCLFIKKITYFWNSCLWNWNPTHFRQQALTRKGNTHCTLVFSFTWNVQSRNTILEKCHPDSQKNVWM